MDAEAQRNAVCCELIHRVALGCGEVRLKVTGSSMLPVIWPGDEITVMRCDYAELQTGQVILYRRNARLTAHRIERKTQDHLVTQGDSLVSFDPPVLPGEVVGRVARVLRNGRHMPLEHSLISRVVSLVIRNSDLSRRLALYFGRYRGRCDSRPPRYPEEMQA